MKQFNISYDSLINAGGHFKLMPVTSEGFIWLAKKSLEKFYNVVAEDSELMYNQDSSVTYTPKNDIL